jgi:predicted amidohydrolase YtcJ
MAVKVVCLNSLILLSATWLSGQQPADIVLHNGKVLTVDANFSTAEGVAITGQRITRVGTNQQVLELAGPNTLRLDLKGRTVVPGLIDTHLHITGPANYAEPVTPEKRRQFSVDWRAVKSKQDVLNQIKSIMDKFKPPAGAWLAFTNPLQVRRSAWTDASTYASDDQVKILYSDLSRFDLDTVLPNNPVMLTMGVPDENALFVNTKAFDILMTKHGDFLKKYGRFWLASNGIPDGHLEPPATRLLLNLYAPKAAPEDMAPGIRKRLEELNAQGHTTISTKLRLHSIEAYKLLEQRGEQIIRMAYGLGWDHFGSIENPAEDLKQFQGVTGSGTDWNWVASVAPSSMDGGGTRACTNHKRLGYMEPIDIYFPMGQCHTDDEYRGGSRSQTISGNYFKDWLINGSRYGLRLANDHVAGDRTVANLLAIAEQAQRLYGPDATKNWAFDHCRYVNPADLAKAARLRVMFSCAPKYIQDSSSVVAAFGDQVANTFIVPIKSMIKAGVRVSYEADRDTYVWEDLELTMTRKDLKGKVWAPHERIDKTEALKLATIWAADYVLKPDKLGSLEVGKLADVVVLDRDYLTIPADEVSDIQPQLTVLDGKIVFVHTQFANEYNLRPQGAVVSTFEELKTRRPARAESLVGDDG